MKIKQILSLSFLVVGAAFFLNSCGGGTEKPNPAPVIDLIAEGGSIVGDVSMEGDSTFSIVFNVSDDKKVKSVEINSTVNGRKSSQLDSTINATSLKIKITRKTLAIIATESWTITATDDEGETTNKTITITTTTDALGPALKSFELDNGGKPFKVWNFHGPNTGAFDLFDLIPLTKNDDDKFKDLHDSTSIAEITQWPGRWVSKNTTTFKKVTSYSYEEIKNRGMLEAAWNGSGSAFKSMLLKADDLYIAKIRNGATHVLVKIVEVKKTSGDNLDYVHFIFKKEP